jgi:aryl-alcohol dehydrogenase-like predicted oxidoreductase
MRDKIVLGTSILPKFNKIESNKLLSSGFEISNLVDTSPNYLNSETILGDYRSEFYGQFKISTKCLHHINNISVAKMKTQFHNSLQNLGVDSVDYLFVHTTDFTDFSSEHFRTLMSFKSKGLAKNIGYSGDNLNLKLFSKNFGRSFDAFMVTHNIVDQGNRRLILEIKDNYSSQIFSKRSMANGFWRTKNIARKILRRRIPDREIYKKRWQNFCYDTPIIKNKMFNEFFLFNYLDEYIDFVCIGLSNQNQVKKLKEILQNPKMIYPISKYHTIWAKSLPEEQALI